MGLERLEERFQNYINKHPENIDRLKSIAEQVAHVQKNMRSLLDEITSDVCSVCSASCCACMPVDGWFTESDYFIFRMLYDAPFDLKVDHDIEMGCSFLGPDGCVLQGDIRPFSCVKVNCKKLSNAIEVHGRLEAFNQLYNDLSKLQEQIWPLLNGFLSCNVVQAQSL